MFPFNLETYCIAKCEGMPEFCITSPHCTALNPGYIALNCQKTGVSVSPSCVNRKLKQFLGNSEEEKKLNGRGGMPVYNVAEGGDYHF